MLDGYTAEPLHTQTEAYVRERQQWIGDAVEVLTGDRALDPGLALPAPMAKGEPRREAEAPNLTVEQEVELREIAGRFGIGREADITLEQAGLPAGHINLIEGGLAWKMAAETVLDGNSSAVVFAGSPHRAMNAAEQEFAHRLTGTDLVYGRSEYWMAHFMANLLPDYEPVHEDGEVDVMPYSYDIDDEHAFVPEASSRLVHDGGSKTTGQLVHIGNSNQRPVFLLRVDRENYTDENGSKKYRKQPDTAALMGFIANVLTAQGDTETAVGLTTSNTYASRAIDAVRAGLSYDRQFGVAMYGRQTLAEIKNETKDGELVVAEPTELMQIPGELRVIHDKLAKLALALQTSTTER